MTEIIVAMIAAFGTITVAYLANRKERKTDRSLADETLDAKNVEISGLTSRLQDCKDEVRWLRSQLADEHPT